MQRTAVAWHIICTQDSHSVTGCDHLPKGNMLDSNCDVSHCRNPSLQEPLETIILIIIAYNLFIVIILIFFSIEDQTYAC